MTKETPEFYELSISRHIAASPDKVWKVMTERFAEWWCPKPWRTEITEMDWRAGGRAAFVLKGPEGEKEVAEGVFLEVTSRKRFAFTDAIATGLKPQTPFMIGIWEIEAEGDGTRYNAAARHWTKEAQEQHKAMGFESGWMKCAEQLAEICER